MSRQSRPLRLILRGNAAFSAVSGTIALAAAPRVTEQLGVEVPWLTRLIGLGLLGFAVGVIAISRLDDERLAREALAVSLADLGWVAGTVVVAALGVLSGRGTVLLAVIALLVADFAIGQLWARRRLLSAGEIAQPALASR